MDDKDSQWVHEDGYGSPAVGGIISGLWDIVAGLFQLAAWAWRRR